MRKAIIPVFVVLSSLFLSGCYLTDGVAQIAKMISGDKRSSETSSETSSSKKEEPPAPVAHPQPTVTVETLP